MNNHIPAWALRAATVEDHGLVKEAHGQGRMQIKWPHVNAVRSWAKQQGWSTPFFGFEEAFIANMLETKENFALALEKSGLEIQVPQQQYTITDETLCTFDALYEGRSSSGRPDRWGILVEQLRDIRRAVEVGVVVNIEGEQPIVSWQGFYSWANGRYHMLEDGYDKWIGDDS